MLRETRTPLKPSSGRSPSTENTNLENTHSPTKTKKKRKADVVVGREQQAHESLGNVSTPPLVDESQRYTLVCYGDNTQPDRIDSESVAFNRLSVSPQSRETTHT